MSNPIDPPKPRAKTARDTSIGRDTLEALAEMLDSQAALAADDPDAQLEALLELGELYENQLTDLEAATDAYGRAFQARPDSPVATKRLAAIYSRSENWDALRGLLEVAARASTPAQKPALLCKLGELLDEQFGEPGRAAAAFSEALKWEPNHLEAIRGLQRIAVGGEDDEAAILAYEREFVTCSDSLRREFLIAQIANRLEATEQWGEALRWWKRQLAANADDIDALQACARLSALQGDRRTHCQLLETLARKLRADDAVEVRLKLAEAYAQNGQVDAAIRVYREALEQAPQSVQIWASLSQLLARGERHLEQSSALRRLIELEEHPLKRRDHEKALAALLAGPLNDADAAIELLRHLANEAPEPSVTTALEEVLTETGRVDELISWFEQVRADAALGSAEHRELGLRVAALLGESAGRWLDAAQCYRAIAEEYPDEPRVTPLLESALRAAGDRAGLADHLREQIDRGNDLALQSKQQLELATLLEEFPDTTGEIEARLTQLVEGASDPDLAFEAGQRLCALFEREKRWDALYQRLLVELDGCSDPSRLIEIHERCALLCRHRRHDPQAAVPHLEEALRYAPRRADLWQQVAALAQRNGDVEKVLFALEGELSTTPSPEREVSLRAQAAAICRDELSDPARSRTHLEYLLALAPDHLDAVEFFAEELERAGDTAALEAHLERYLQAIRRQPRDEAGAQAARRDTIILRMAELAAETAGDEESDAAPLDSESTDAAVRVLVDAVSTHGPSPRLAQPLANYYRKQGQFEELTALALDVLATNTDCAVRAEWHIHHAQALEALDRSSEAIAAYQEASALIPEDDRALEALENLYRQRGGTESLARLLEARLTRTAGSEEIPLRLELAALLASPPIERGEAALVHLQRVIELDPRNRDARCRGVALAKQLGKAVKEIEFLDAELRHTQDGSSRSAILLRESQLFDRDLQDAERAIALLRQALAIDPAHGEIYEALSGLLRSEGHWTALLSLIHAAAKQREGGARVALIEDGVATASQHAPELLLPWLERLRKERPSDPEILLDIAEEHRRQRCPAAQVHALAQAYVLCPEPGRCTAIQLERADVMEHKLEGPAQALEILRRANADLPETPSLLEEIARLSASLSSFRECAEALEILCKLREGEAQSAAHLRAAEVWEKQLDAPARAARHTKAALGMEEDDGCKRLELLQQLGTQLRAAHAIVDWAATAEEELCALTADAPVFAERRRFLHAQLGQAYRLELNDPERALDHFRALLDDPANPAEASSSPRAVSAENFAGLDLEEADAILVGLLRAAGRSEELAERIKVRLERDPERPDEWLELGQLWEETLHRPSSAAMAYGEVLDRWPDSKLALRGLRRVSERLGEWERVVSCLERELELLPDGVAESAASFWRRIGEICWTKLQSTTHASRAFAAALEVHPGDLPSIHALQELFEAMGDWRGAIDLYQSEIDVLGEDAPARTREIWIRIAAIALEHTEEPQRAKRAYEAAAKAAPLAPGECAALARIYRDEGDLAHFVEYYTVFCDAADGTAQWPDHVELASAYRELGEVEEAIERYHRALVSCEAASDPSGLASTWLTIAEICESLGRRDEASQGFAEAAAHLPSDRAVESLEHAALLLEAENPARAIQLLKDAIEADPAQPSAHASLTRVSHRASDWETAAASALRTLDLASSCDLLTAEVKLETAHLGAIAACEGGDLPTASLLYRQAMEIDPNHSEIQGHYAEVLYELGEYQGAQSILERRLTFSIEDEERAGGLALLGACLEQTETENCDAAKERFMAALECDAQNQRATDGLLRIFECEGNADQAIALLDQQSAEVQDPQRRGQILLRAAKIEIERGGEVETIIEKLREAIAAKPDETESWLLLVEHLAPCERAADLVVSARGGLEHASCPRQRATLAHYLGEGLEALDQPREAADAFALAQREDPSQIPDVLHAAELLRALGAWRDAADLLELASESVPNSVPAQLRGQLFHQLGRLRSGPLEDIQGATQAYRAALELHPELREAKEALALILVHQPEAWKEAMARHRELLDEDPTRDASVQAILKVLRHRKKATAERDGLAILHALGIGAVPGSDEPALALSFQIGTDSSFADPLWEKARRVFQTAKSELAKALEVRNQDPSHTEEEGDTSAEVGFRMAALAAEGDLTAPALVPLDDAEVGELLQLICHLSLGSEQVEGDGSLVNALSAALSRRTQRRIRRILGETTAREIGKIDIEAWRCATRDLAAVRALDEIGGDLGAALRVLIREGSDAEITDGDLRSQARSCPAAWSLLRGVVLNWVDRISLR